MAEKLKLAPPPILPDIPDERGGLADSRGFVRLGRDRPGGTAAWRMHTAYGWPSPTRRSIAEGLLGHCANGVVSR